MWKIFRFLLSMKFVWNLPMSLKEIQNVFIVWLCVLRRSFFNNIILYTKLVMATLVQNVMANLWQNLTWQNLLFSNNFPNSTSQKDVVATWIRQATYQQSFVDWQFLGLAGTSPINQHSVGKKESRMQIHKLCFLLAVIRATSRYTGGIHN